MINAAENRQILFGILAAKNQLVPMDQIHDAFGRWLTGQRPSLPDILSEQGWLTNDQREQLDSQVDKQLAEFSGDQSTQLPAASDPDETRLGDSGTVGQGPVSNTQTLHHSSGTDRYRIVRPHARGGLGEVYVALDAELDREVALKQIQQEFADNPERRDRFVREAEITGKLEHPGIVPVYSRGADSNGRPYYVMKLIRGKSMRDAIREFHSVRVGRSHAERNRELRKLLGWFVDVCEAIAYAHSRGVLHRDLKPANIMLGRYGETLVVDWGLARAATDRAPDPASDEMPVQTRLGSGSSETVLGTAVGTPAYMSPEQAEGRLDLVSPHSDIYSLGATLYSILTGKTPVQGSHAGEILGRVSRGDFQPPGTVADDVNKGLEAVCLKAMSLKPNDRYETPLALAADVEAWLADEPVSAWAEPLTVRTGRWVKNHQTLVAGVAATVVVALVGSLIASGLLSSKNRELAQAKSVAEDNATVANEQSELALNTMTQVIHDFQDVFSMSSDLLSQPNTMDREELVAQRMQAQRRMITNALTGMRSVADNLKDHSDYSDALVVAHLELGTLFMSIGKEDFSDARQDAHDEYQVARELCRKWLDANPEDTQAKMRYADVLTYLGSYWQSIPEPDKSIRLAEEARENLEALASQQTENTAVYRKLLANYFTLGTLQFRMRYDMEKAVYWNQQYIDLVDEGRERGFDFPSDYQRDYQAPEARNRVLIFSSVPKIREDIEFANTLPRELQARAMYDTAASLIFEGEHEQAFRILQAMDSMDNVSAQDFYQNACGYAKCAMSVLDGRKPAELSQAESALVEKYNQLAVESLNKSRAGGFFDDARVVALAGRDADLNSLRERADFRQFWEEVVEAVKPKTDSSEESDPGD